MCRFWKHESALYPSLHRVVGEVSGSWLAAGYANLDVGIAGQWLHGGPTLTRAAHLDVSGPCRTL